MSDTKISQLKEVMADTFEIDRDEIEDDSSPESIPAWTSLSHLGLMAAVEEAFHITLSMDEMTEISSFGDLKRVVGSHSV